MRIIDADGHVEENSAMFSDKYFDPAIRAQRLRISQSAKAGIFEKNPHRLYGWSK